MKSKLITIASILIATLSFAACSDSSSSSEDSAAILALAALASAPADLPQPALDTANMTVDGASLVFTHKVACAEGNIALQATVGNPPILNLHNFSFSASNLVFAEGAAVINLDVNDGSYDVSSTCTGKVMENSATVYDLQVKDCALKTAFGAPNPPAPVVSFRVRCTKG